jgi:hypothetical protein
MFLPSKKTALCAANILESILHIDHALVLALISLLSALGSEGSAAWQYHPRSKVRQGQGLPSPGVLDIEGIAGCGRANRRTHAAARSKQPLPSTFQRVPHGRDDKSDSGDRYAANQQPHHPREDGFDSPFRYYGNRRQRVTCSLGGGFDRPADEMRIVCLQTVDDNAAANPDHGRSANSGEKRQKSGHTENQPASECAAHHTGS